MIHYRLASVSEILDLRHQVLRPGKPLETAHFSGDSDEDTLHFGAFESGVSVCCFTLLPSHWEDEAAWQLRGMASAPSVRGKGVARTLVNHAFSLPEVASYAPLFWCNAREAAIPFYTKTGWEIHSDFFDVPGIGPHVKMIRRKR